MHISPSQSNAAPRQGNSNESAVLPAAQQARPGGVDQPDDRMALDNSRAVAPAYFGLQPDGRLRVSQDIRQLLSLRSNVVDLNASDGEEENDGAFEAAPSRQPREPVFAAPVRLPRADVAPVAPSGTIDSNIPPSSYRFLSMSLPALLQEVADRAIGNGPPDPVAEPNLTIEPEDRRRSDMVWALQNQPGRERDAQVLRNAGVLLADFLAQYKWLVAAVREKRPDLEPMMAEWTAELVREPLRKVLERPFDPNEELTYASGFSSEMRENIERPYDAHVAELDARMGEQRRFSELPLLSLLHEAALRAIGNGPPDARPPTNSAASPEMNRINEMVRVLQTVPGRHNDAITLLNAGRLLRYVFSEMRTLMRDARSRRPDLEPVLESWITDLVRSALQRALDVPGVGDRSFVLDERVSWSISEVARQPLDSYITGLDRRLMQRLEPGFMARFSEFFAQMSRPGKPGETPQNVVLGAAPGDRSAPDVQRLLQGHVVFRCTPWELTKNMQMIPAATMSSVPILSTFRAPGVKRTVRWLAQYPQRTGDNWVKAVSWAPPVGMTTPVFVSIQQGVHSYSVDQGHTWKPTGGPSLPLMDKVRADQWSEFLEHRRAGSPPGSSRRDVESVLPRD